MNTMGKRRIAPTFMLPKEFPNPKIKDIYVVLRGGMHNVYIASAQEFRYKNRVFGIVTGDRKSTSTVYRVEDLSSIEHILGELTERNNGFVDLTMVFEQGQRAFYDLKKQLAGTRSFGEKEEAILRFTKQGEIYLPAEIKK